METLSLSRLRGQYPEPDRRRIADKLAGARRNGPEKIVVLDDDPTGVQTVHDVNVYTDWSAESVRAGFEEAGSMFYILTNSRSFFREKTGEVHALIARNILRAARETGRSFLIVSRGDSTLRGHWPLETRMLRETMESLSDIRYDAEILVPFFSEGGRYTVGNVHYVADGDRLIPAGRTEFARDDTFGYASSDLREWIEEKTAGRIRRDEVCAVGLPELRSGDTDAMAARLQKVSGFGKVIVNALDDSDIEAFSAALLTAYAAGSRFILRTAAAVPKVLGGVVDRPLLTRRELVPDGDPHGGLIVVGSHVQRTSDQLEELRRCPGIHFVEFNQYLAGRPELFGAEIARAAAECAQAIRRGVTAAVYTRRKMADPGSAGGEGELALSVRISQGVTRIVRGIRERPAFIVAKGGITSSDIGVNGLGVRRARVLGQILPGVPVWRTGEESRFPGISYVIFPGNVGGRTALLDAVRTLLGK